MSIENWFCNTGARGHYFSMLWVNVIMTLHMYISLYCLVEWINNNISVDSVEIKLKCKIVLYVNIKAMSYICGYCSVHSIWWPIYIHVHVFTLLYLLKIFIKNLYALKTNNALAIMLLMYTISTYIIHRITDLYSEK